MGKKEQNVARTFGQRIRKSRIKERSGLGKAWDFMMVQAIHDSRVSKPETPAQKLLRQQREWHL